MKKKSVAKVFLKSLLKSILGIIIVLAVGLASYKISYTILSNNSENVGTSSDDIQDIIEEAQTDEISKNLIYVCKDNKITHLMVEICNTNTYNMDYVTIPVKTDYTIPTTMYQKLCTVNEEIPQIVRLGKMKQYFSDEDDAYGYGELIIEKMLGVKISYYTVIDQDTYNNHYQQKKAAVKFKLQSLADTSSSDSTDATSTTAPSSEKTKVYEKISVASDAYVSQLKDIAGDEEKIAEFIKEQYDRVESNLTVYNKIGYVECYEKMDVDMFHYWGIPGVYSDGVFQVDTKAAKIYLNNLIDNDTTYTEAQTFGKSASSSKNSSVKSSKGLNILVLNGSQITGLASTTQTELNNAGFTVNDVGDYTTETLTQTKIIVKEKGVGEDLVSYFNDPELTVGTVKDGYDIEIILGTADAN